LIILKIVSATFGIVGWGQLPPLPPPRLRAWPRHRT